MKLSEAIRLGSMMKPQAFNGYGYERNESCAVQAAVDAVALHPTSERFTGVSIAFYDGKPVSCPQEWEWFVFVGDFNEMPFCPECADRKGSYWSVVTHLNDTHRWTRERIADWVETIENAQSAPVEAQPVEAQQ